MSIKGPSVLSKFGIFLFLGGPSFISAVHVLPDHGLQPLKLRRLKPPIKGPCSSGLKSRPPKSHLPEGFLRIKTLPVPLGSWISCAALLFFQLGPPRVQTIQVVLRLLHFNTSRL